VTVRAYAKELGVNPGTFGAWVRKYERDAWEAKSDEEKQAVFDELDRRKKELEEELAALQKSLGIVPRKRS